MKDIIIKKEFKKSSTETLIRENIEEFTVEDYKPLLQYVMNKIINKYKHDNVMKQINYIIDTHIMKYINSITDLLVDIDKILYNAITIFKKSQGKTSIDEIGELVLGIGSYRKRKIIYDINSNISIFFTQNQDLMVNMMDLYFLRRFLDKDYVTNAIGYTGALHSTNYIFYLVKYFDFKITHWSYLREDIKKVYNIIKKSDNVHQIEMLFYTDYPYQCTDLSSFPSDFE